MILYIIAVCWYGYYAINLDYELTSTITFLGFFLTTLAMDSAVLSFYAAKKLGLYRRFIQGLEVAEHEVEMMPVPAGAAGTGR